MKKQVLEHVYWGDISTQETYLYGSKIDYYDKMVVFENLTYASGKPIKTWRSRTNYQASRRSPQLPILYAGQRYHLEAVMTTTPSARAYFQVTYFNRQKEEIGFDILRGEKQEFTYPEDAFTYTITLVNGGCQSLTFSHLILSTEETKTPMLFLPAEKSAYYKTGTLPSELAFVKGLLEKTLGD